MDSLLLTNLKNGLIVDVPMNEGAGTGLVDHSGYGNHFVQVGTGNPWIGSSRGHALSGFSANTIALNLSSHPSVSGLESITVACWCRRVTGGPFEEVISQNEPTGNLRAWTIAVDDTNNAKAQVRITDDGVGAPKQYRSSLDAFDGSFHHVAFTFDGRTSLLEIYVDGTRDTATTKLVDDSISVIFDSTSPIVIGGRGDPNENFFIGQVSSAKMWRRALSEQEVRQDFVETYIPRL